MTPLERLAIDYSQLEQGIAHLEQVIRDTRRTLDLLARGEQGSSSSQSGIGEDDGVAGELEERH